MPFSEPTPFIVEVTSADIAAASNTSNTTSLITALKRMKDAGQLPGQDSTDNYTDSQFLSFINPRLMNGQLVSAVDVVCISVVYSLDINSSLIILLELLGTKPLSPYTATMTHA